MLNCARRQSRLVYSDAGAYTHQHDALIRLPQFSREQLHNRKLAKTRHGSLVESGKLKASKARADGLYILEFHPASRPDPKALARVYATPDSPPSPDGVVISKSPDGKILVPSAESLDQATVDRIRAVTKNEPAWDF